MEKLTLQAFSELYAERYGVSRKFADSFLKAFFDEITEGLKADGVVKINGLGTFKIIKTADRESVNVNNGERILIRGYSKVGFSPSQDFLDKTVKTERAPQCEELPSSDALLPAVAPLPAEETSMQEEIPQFDEQPLFDALPPFDDNIKLTNIEIPMNEIGSIDTLISTPESIEDVRNQYEQAQAKAEEAFALAQETHSEMLRLKALLKKLEANEPPAISQREEQNSEPTAQPVEVLEEEKNAQLEVTAQQEIKEPEVITPSESLIVTENDSAIVVGEKEQKDEEKEKALKNIMNSGVENNDDNEEAEVENQKTKRNWIIALVVAVVLAAVGYYAYVNEMKRRNVPIEIIMGEEEAEQIPDSAATDTVAVEGQKVAGVQDNSKEQKAAEAPKSAAAQKEKKAASSVRPKNHTVQSGESLTRISLQYYGTKDSVSAIIRANNIENPNNVNAGVVLRLP